MSLLYSTLSQSIPRKNKIKRKKEREKEENTAFYEEKITGDKLAGWLLQLQG